MLTTKRVILVITLLIENEIFIYSVSQQLSQFLDQHFKLVG